MKVKFRGTDNPYASKEWVLSRNLTGVQRRVIVHCILYYVYEQPVLIDAEYDELAKQLEQLQKKAPKEVLERTKYWYCMEDFCASTGFDVHEKLNAEDKKRFEREAAFVLSGYERYGKK